VEERAMSTAFVPCSACARHVKTSDAACPFCGQVIDAAPAPATSFPPRTSRAALLAVGASAILGAAGCSTGSPPTDDAGADGAPNPLDATADVPSAQPLYGAVVPPKDAAEETVTVLPLYGAAPGH
jgi:hypothetical protein